MTQLKKVIAIDEDEQFEISLNDAVRYYGVKPEVIGEILNRKNRKKSKTIHGIFNDGVSYIRFVFGEA